MTREEMEIADAALQAEIRELIAEAPSVSAASILIRLSMPMGLCGIGLALMDLFH